MAAGVPIPTELGRAACADPQHLPLVDAAHAKPGGPEAQEMKRRLCRGCPVAATCFEWAMTHAECGVWGGTTPKARTQRGAPNRLAIVPVPARHPSPPPLPPTSRRGPQPNRRTPNTTLRLAELGVSGAEVKRWALDHGLTGTLKGRVSLVHIEAYATGQS